MTLQKAVSAWRAHADWGPIDTKGFMDSIEYHSGGRKWKNQCSVCLGLANAWGAATPAERVIALLQLQR